MFLSNLSIKRPVFAAVLMLALVTLGLFSYRRLPLDLYPNVEIPVLVITTKFPGASPESVEREVTKKVEEAVNPIAGIKHVTSTSLEGVSFVVAQFQLEVKINDASQEARAKVGAIRGDLPQGIEEPVIQKVDFSAMPVVSLAVRSETLSPRDLSTLVEKKVKRRLENVSGVGKVDLVGLAKREVEVRVDPARLEGFGMGVDELVVGLAGESVNTPLGRLTRGAVEVPLRISGKPAFVDQFGPMVVAQRNGRPVTLSQVADVVDGVEEQRTLAFVNGAPAVGINVQKQSGANTVEVVDAIKKQVTKLRAELPAGTSVTVVRDASTFIRDSVEDVVNSLILGGLLTIFIVFCFLNSWRSTVITGLTLPISVISSFIVMNFMGMTLNVMTLMALSLAIGLLIDDAIVVRENIVRHLEHGKDHFAAARDGTSEIGLAVLATTFSIVAVFVPVAFMKGIVGRFFFSFGITVTFAVLVSLFVSFTLDPMLSSRWVDPDIERKGRRHLVARLLDRFNGAFDRAADVYRGAIGWALNHRLAVVLAAVAAFAGGLAVFGSLESNFMPAFDKGEFQVDFKAAPDASLRESRDRLQAVLAEIRRFPEVAHTYGTIGAGDKTVRDATVFVKLVEKADRRKSDAQIRRELREGLRKIPGIVSSVMDADSFQGVKALQVNLRGDDIDLLKKYGAQLKAEVRKIPGIVDLEVTLEHDIPEFRLQVDRQRAADAGLTTAQVVRTVGTLVGGQAVSTYEDEDGDAVDVRLRLPEAMRQDVAQVENLRVAAPRFAGRALVPLGEFVRYEMKATPTEIGRQDLSRQVVLSANLDGLPLGTAVKEVQKAAARVPMAPGYRVVFSGEAEDMAESFGYMAEALLLAVIFVYLILAAQFESFIDPLSIMLSLPLSLVGMAGMLRLTGDTISIMSLIGLIMLMGLVTKNAILLIDYAKILRAQGVSRRDALVTAGRTRLRPILMTTLAMIFGMLPLALALGAGAEMRAPMARAVIGGLVTSTFLTLLVVPVVYAVLDDFAAWLRRVWGGGQAKEVEEEDRVVPLNARRKFFGMFAIFGIGLLAVGLLAARTARGEEAAHPPVRVLTLSEALRLSAERNRDIQKALELRRSLEGRYVEERAAALPQVTLTGNVLRQRDESQAMTFPTATVGAGGQPTFGTTTVVPPPATVTTLDAGLSQALFTWGQVGAAIRAAKVGLLTADDQLRVARQAAARDVTQAFYDVLVAKEFNAVARHNLEQRLRHWDEGKKRYSAGVATDYDVLSAEVAVANARPEVIRTENMVRLARDQLRFLLAVGEEIDVDGTLVSGEEPIPAYEEALARAKEHRPELSDLRHRIEVSRELVTIRQAGDKPRVDLKANWGYRNVDAGPDERWGQEWSAGIFASWPIFDGWKTAGKVAQAKSDLASLRIDEQKLLDSIALNVRDASNAVRQAAETVRALSGTVTQAERLLSMAEKGFQYGVKTKLEVDDAELSLIQARTNLAKARRDYLVARTTLEWVMGTLE